MKRIYFPVLVSAILIFFLQGCNFFDAKALTLSYVTKNNASVIIDDGILDIWTIGDSITQGTNNGYRNQLWADLTEAGYEINYVGTLEHAWPDTSVCTDADHDGHSGYTISRIDESLDDYYAVIEEEHPELVLVMLGTNDLAWWVSGESVVNSSDENMIELAEHILSLNNRICVIVGTIPPMSSEAIEITGADRAEYAIRYNAALTEQVQSHELFGSRLFLADTNSSLTVDDLSDGIHPTREGYDKLGRAWADAVKNYVVLPE